MKMTEEEVKIINDAFGGLASCDSWDYSTEVQAYWDRIAAVKAKIMAEVEPA